MDFSSILDAEDLPWRGSGMIFEGLGSSSENQWFLRGTLEGSRLRQHGQVVVKPRSVGPDPPHSQQDHHPPVSMILYTDSRILNTGYRISYRIHWCRIQESKDQRMEIRRCRIKGYRIQSVHTLRSLVAPLRGAGGFIYYIYIYIYIYRNSPSTVNQPALVKRWVRSHVKEQTYLTVPRQ